MSQPNSTSRLFEQFDEHDFEAMRDDGHDEYRIRFQNGRERRTCLTVIAYYARLDPEATVTLL